MKRAAGWAFAAICLILAVLAVIFSFIVPPPGLPGSFVLRPVHFLTPVVIGWIAVVPRSRDELRVLWRSHPLAQRFRGGAPGGFFGDYRRRLTALGRALLIGAIGLFSLFLWQGTVHVGMIIVGAFYLVAHSFWIIRLELDGDPLAAVMRQTASALVYHRVKKHGS